MCKDCLREFRPDRGTMCLDKGQYILNLKGCAKCGARSPKIIERKVEEEEDEDGDYTETITFTHICAQCSHEICQHYYTFEADNKCQEYLMECPLCGRGAQTSYFDFVEEGKDGKNIREKSNAEIDIDVESQGRILAKQVDTIREKLHKSLDINSEAKAAVSTEDDAGDDDDGWEET
mmetsp:Transcript_7796/g.14510  ORF Transcript_7796/g.14510 Transcript_7796/m.14510 type:complete len:177 (+) Transcript_7796:81-611(+)